MAGFKTRTGVGYSVPVITYRCVLYLLLHYAHTPQQTSRRESEREKREAPSQTQYFAESLRVTAQFQVFITLSKKT